jgi:hypothetical protein
MPAKLKQYAIAVRDGKNLLLHLTVCRSASGDVYVNVPRDHEPKWKPHSSYHASGQHHHKSFNHKALLKHRQKPGANFRGTENVVTQTISVDEVRAVNSICRPADYEQVFEVPADQLGTGQTLVSVDLSEPNGKPIITPGPKTLQEHSIRDGVPWILITVFENTVRQVTRV